jgi:ribosomal protein S18 acetylase RimI-like enzyme
MWHELERTQHAFRTFPVADDADDRFLASFDEAVSSAAQCFLVAVDGADVVGMAHCREDRPSKMSDERAVEIGRVVVVGARRGSGVGRALFEAAADFARERGAGVVTARIFSANNEALGFWRAIGFKPSVEILARPVGRGSA